MHWHGNDHVEALVQGRLGDPLYHLGVIGAAGNPALSEIRVRVYVGSSEDAARIESLWEELLARSPLVRTLSPVVRLELDLKLTP